MENAYCDSHDNNRPTTRDKKKTTKRQAEGGMNEVESIA